MPSLMQLAAEHPFLQGLTPDHLKFVVDCAVEENFPAGHNLLTEGDAANQFYLICTGKVALGTFVPGRGLTTIQTLENGELIGWSWLVPPYQWRFSALTISAVHTITLDANKLREQCDHNPDFGYEFTKRVLLVMGQRLTATRMRLED